MFRLFLPRFFSLVLLLARLTYASFNSHDDPCVPPTDPQPIAIYFGPDVITAAYAHSQTNITILADINVHAADSPIPGYVKLIYGIRRQYYEREFPPTAVGGSKPDLPVPGLTKSEELPTVPSFAKEELDNAVKAIKDAVWQEAQTEITSAVIVVPQFIGNELASVLERAVEDAGIMAVGVRTPQEVFSTYVGVLPGDFREVEHAERVRNILTVEVGWAYLDVRTTGRGCRMEWPWDMLGCSAIPSRITDRLLWSTEYLQTEINQGASLDNLFVAVNRAWGRMKAGVEAIEPSQWLGKDGQVWPLELDGWWVGESREVVLRWEGTKAVEEDHANQLTEALKRALIRRNEMGSECYSKKLSQSDREIEAAVILGNYCISSYVYEAVRRALPHHVNIIRANAYASETFVAEGAARSSLYWRRTTTAAFEQYCMDHARHDEL